MTSSCNQYVVRGVRTGPRQVTVTAFRAPAQLPPEYKCGDCGFRTYDDDCREDCPRCGSSCMDTTVAEP